MYKVVALLAVLAVAAEAGTVLSAPLATTSLVGGHAPVYTGIQTVPHTTVVKAAPQPLVYYQGNQHVIPNYYGLNNGLTVVPQSSYYQSAVVPQPSYIQSAVVPQSSYIQSAVVPQSSYIQSAVVPSSGVQYIVGANGLGLGNGLVQPIGQYGQYGQYVLTK